MPVGHPRKPVAVPQAAQAPAAEPMAPDSTDRNCPELRLVAARDLTTAEAATLLAVSPSLLRSWQTEYDFPTAEPTAGQHRNFNRIEVLLLREALASEASIPAALARARERAGRPTY
jgi:hypothetical protein